MLGMKRVEMKRQRIYKRREGEVGGGMEGGG